MAATEWENKRKLAAEKEQVTPACAVDRIPGPKHDASVVTTEQLMDVFRGLPSLYEKHFVPSVMEKPGRPD